MADNQERADRIRAFNASASSRNQLNYEREALESIARSWELEERECQALALADAQVWATLQLARVTEED